jgi:hypothetical protein
MDPLKTQREREEKETVEALKAPRSLKERGKRTL